ncbi:hypothetical protein ACFSM5_05270 [Lacibacterium aquatile]|uniref:Uncharacterized protein n=1 Tax=Lacibacterium aquatile TaxID=1168082 RepID=A0ABW5DQW5_9PROT
MRLYGCEEILDRQHPDGSRESFYRHSEIGYFPAYNLFLEVLTDSSACCARQAITQIGDEPSYPELPDWLR